MEKIDDSPQFQIFNEIYKLSLSLGYKTFDYLPDAKAGYPFVFVGATLTQDKTTKTGRYGDIQQTIHVYGNHMQRREVTRMVDNLNARIRRIETIDNRPQDGEPIKKSDDVQATRPINLNVKEVNGQVLPDNSTPTPLIHGIIELDMTFN